MKKKVKKKKCKKKWQKKTGDLLLKINEEDISHDPSLAMKTLKECVMSGETFSLTFLRIMFEKVVVTISRAGTINCNGKYEFLKLNNDDTPVFMHTRQELWHITRIGFDPETEESVWAIRYFLILLCF